MNDKQMGCSPWGAIYLGWYSMVANLTHEHLWVCCLMETLKFDIIQRMKCCIAVWYSWILLGMKQKLKKSCFQCKKNTRHIKSNYLLQPPKYLIIVVNRFRYINNIFTKDRCSIPMDMTVVLGLHKFSLQATINHHGPSMYSGHYTAFIKCCKRTFYCNDSKITELKTIDTKNSFTAYVVMYKLIT